MADVLKLIRAAAYIRMSGRQQDKSPAEQRAEISKLAAREGCQVVQWYTDEAITGDSSTSSRPGLAALLQGAGAGTFKVVLAWHTNRISREDPMDAIVFYNQLRKAGVGLHTCCEGAIDLEDFAKQLLLFINQKANNDFLIEMSAKTLRGRIANAKAGGHNGGPAIYGMDRGLFDSAGNLVRASTAASTSGKQGTGYIFCLPPIKRKSTLFVSPSRGLTVRTLASETWRESWRRRATRARPARVGHTTTCAGC